MRLALNPINVDKLRDLIATNVSVDYDLDLGTSGEGAFVVTATSKNGKVGSYIIDPELFEVMGQVTNPTTGKKESIRLLSKAMQEIQQFTQAGNDEKALDAINSLMGTLYFKYNTALPVQGITKADVSDFYNM